MAQPPLNLNSVDPNQAAWDATVDGNFTAIDDHLTGQPLAVKEYSLLSGLPTASSYNNCLAAVTADTDSRNNGVWRSNGTSWVKVVDSGSHLMQALLLLARSNAQILELQRYANAAGKVVIDAIKGLRSGNVGAAGDMAVTAYQQESSTGVVRNYAEAGSEIITATNGSEDGDFTAHVLRAGTARKFCVTGPPRGLMYNATEGDTQAVGTGANAALNCFDTTKFARKVTSTLANARWTITDEGDYQFYFSTNVQSSLGTTVATFQIYKNGSTVAGARQQVRFPNSNDRRPVSLVWEEPGLVSTDQIEIRVSHDNGGSVTFTWRPAIWGCIQVAAKS